MLCLERKKVYILYSVKTCLMHYIACSPCCSRLELLSTDGDKKPDEDAKAKDRKSVRKPAAEKGPEEKKAKNIRLPQEVRGPGGTTSGKGHGERSRLQLLFKLGGPENLSILAVNVLGANVLAVNRPLPLCTA